MDCLIRTKEDFSWAEATSRSVVVTSAASDDCRIIFVNAAFTVLTGYEYEELVGRNCRFLQGSDTDRCVVREIREALSEGVSIRRELLNYRKNGEPFWNDLTLDPIRGESGSVTGFIGLQYEATEARIARDARVAAEIHLQSVVRHLPGYVYRRVLKPDGAIEIPYLSPSVNGILGMAPDATINAAEFFRHVHPDDYENFMLSLRRSGADLSVFHEEFRLISTSGTVRWFRSDAPARPSPDGGVIWDGIAIDITAEKTSETELAFLTSHDSLTGLSNRVRFKNALLTALKSDVPDKGEMGVFFIDVDDFQEINDTLGQSAGDDVLRTIGQRLLGAVDDAPGLVARLGGDEFAVLLSAIPANRTTAELAETIRRQLAEPMHIADQEIIVQVCVGATVFSGPHRIGAEGDESVEIMKQADMALHAAKQEGPGSHCIYAAEFDDRIRNRMALRQSLHRAVEGEQFELHYHPLVELASGQVVGAEALVRWNHPVLGLQQPNMFIPLAEASGLIVPLGAWVIKEAMRQQQPWKQLGARTPRIAINVSSVQLMKPGFIAAVEDALSATGADPRDFEFELTEGVLIEPSPEILAILGWVKSLGFGITIDDFGTGYSTFKYLRDFPIDKIKIDQTFVRQLVIDSSDASIIRAMIALAGNLGIKIVAEGIETAMQRDFLRDEGCEIGQGFLFSLPLTAEDFGWLLQSAMTLPVAVNNHFRAMRTELVI